MGIYRERMNAHVARTDSPDGHIRAQLTQQTTLDLRFARGSYDRYDEETLENQLSVVLRDLFGQQQRAHFAALSAAFGHAVTSDTKPRDTKPREYHERLRRITATGTGAGRQVKVGHREFREWEVRIADGALTELSDDEFRQELASALQAMIENHMRQKTQIRQDIWPPVARVHAAERRR